MNDKEFELEMEKQKTKQCYIEKIAGVLLCLIIIGGCTAESIWGK